jgi:diguanylate cyclase (GGDEF)-like protein
VASEQAAVDPPGKLGPWQSSRLFWCILALAFLSVLIPSGPSRPVAYVAGIVLLAGVAAARWWMPWSRISRRALVLPLLLDTAAITCLIYSAGKSTGLGSLLLLPLLYSAFYGVPAESWLVIPAIAVAQCFIGLANNDSAIVLTRVLVFWVALLVVISLAAHAVRRSLQASIHAAHEEARQSAVVAEATRAITAPLDPDLVISAAARLAAEMVSPIATSGRRGQYFAVDGETLRVVAESDETGMAAGAMVLAISDHPSARAVLETGEAINGPIDRDACGPSVRSSLEAFGITHGAYVPITVDAKVVGILNASGRGEAIRPGLFERLQLLGRLTGLALANAAAHQLLEAQALSDPLTNLANRRELERAFQRLPLRLPFAFVAIDLDDLKGINDRWGHAAGDAAIVAVASGIAAVARRGDTVARVGGDEFSVLMIDANFDAAERLADRIHDAMTRVSLHSGQPRLSIGCCVAAPGSDTGLVQGLADTALYEAKHRGGSSTVIRTFHAEEPAVLIA